MKIIFFTVSSLLMEGHIYSKHEQENGILISSKNKTWLWGQKLGRGGSSISEVRSLTEEVSKEHAWDCTEGG